MFIYKKDNIYPFEQIKDKFIQLDYNISIKK